MTAGPTPAADGGPLAFVHLGDLHLTDARQRNYVDLLAIVAQIEIECAATVDFVVLPGDNADNGTAAQYALAATALKMLSVPIHAITGDHDMEQGGLDAFRAGLAAEPLPRAVTVRGQRCLFLDISGPGSGGPDFRLGAAQMAFVERELDAAAACGQTSVVFMHSYPADLCGVGETDWLNGILATHDVALVDMGHTHYNELGNDGAVIFAATRSTGQIEEGPPGYAIATLDAGIVSWRFRALDESFPFVIVTAPADHRLLRGAGQAVCGEVEVRALVLGARALRAVACRIEDGDWMPMDLAPDGRTWTTRVAVPPSSGKTVDIVVRAIDATGRPGQHAIRAATPACPLPARARDGSDAVSVGAWPENGIFGTQLGPNRNGGPL